VVLATAFHANDAMVSEGKGTMFSFSPPGAGIPEMMIAWY
jgi:hypothetical protein